MVEKAKEKAGYIRSAYYLPISLLITSDKASAGNHFVSKWITALQQFYNERNKGSLQAAYCIVWREEAAGRNINRGPAASTILWHKNELCVGVWCEYVCIQGVVVVVYVVCVYVCVVGMYMCSTHVHRWWSVCTGVVCVFIGAVPGACVCVARCVRYVWMWVCAGASSPKGEGRIQEAAEWLFSLRFLTIHSNYKDFIYFGDFLSKSSSLTRPSH